MNLLNHAILLAQTDQSEMIEDLMAQQAAANGAADSGILGGLCGLTCMLPAFILMIIWIVGLWKIFEKAGKPGWASIIPIYNVYVALEICGRPGWPALLLLIPFLNALVGLVLGIIIAIDMAQAFGKDTVYALGLILLPFIFYPMLGFSDAQYQPINR